MQSKLQQSIDYISSVRERVLELESELAEIKKSDEWKKAMNYLWVAQNNMSIDEAPTKLNGYRVPVVYKNTTIN